MKIFISSALLVITLFISCTARDKAPIGNITSNEVHDSIAKPQTLKYDLQVSAHLRYEDGTFSSFDVLNDKNIALWNTIIGEGDALKPSNSTKISITGNLDGLAIKIKNGGRLVLDTTVVHSSKDIEYIIKNTGCAVVYVNLVRNKKLLYYDSIQFHCGE